MVNEIIHTELWEHWSEPISLTESTGSETFKSKRFQNKGTRYCFQILRDPENQIRVSADYFIGVDWLVKGKHSIVVVPKINSRKQAESDNTINCNVEADTELPTPQEPVENEKEAAIEIDYFQVLNTCLSVDFLYKEIDDLVHIDWVAKEVPIRQEQDFLTPLLIVKFLGVLKSIVRKGLKKSYYKVEQNLDSRVKGKILAGRHINQNVVKNQLTKTWCRFEVFGVDDVENRLLKKALGFCRAYIDNHERAFGKGNHAQNLVNYCQPAFGSVADEVDINRVRSIKPNPLFREYTEGIELAKQILKRCSYSISNAAKETKSTPPYWIDMPKLFELYAYSFLRKLFPNQHELKYHHRTHGNELDFLLNSGKIQMVVDAKYKAYYTHKLNHQDMRQVSGYARLKKTYKDFGLPNSTELIKCLIVYPDSKKGVRLENFTKDDLQKHEIQAYEGIYKVGIWLPEKGDRKSDK